MLVHVCATMTRQRGKGTCMLSSHTALHNSRFDYPHPHLPSNSTPSPPPSLAFFFSSPNNSHPAKKCRNVAWGEIKGFCINNCKPTCVIPPCDNSATILKRVHTLGTVLLVTKITHHKMRLHNKQSHLQS